MVMNLSATSKRRSRLILWLALLVILMIGLAVVITPIWFIQPFKPQTARGLELSYTLRRISPVATVLASLSVVVLAGLLWQSLRWFLKILLVVLLLPLFAATWMARQNHFEWMFRPHAKVAYSPA